MGTDDCEGALPSTRPDDLRLGADVNRQRRANRGQIEKRGDVDRGEV